MDQEREIELRELEDMLVEMWERVLKLDGIGTEEDFFKLGGDSIAAVRFTNMLQERLGEVVQVTVLYEMPTIARMAAYLAESYQAAAAAIFGRPITRLNEPAISKVTESDVAYVRETSSALYRFSAD